MKPIIYNWYITDNDSVARINSHSYSEQLYLGDVLEDGVLYSAKWNSVGTCVVNSGYRNWNLDRCALTAPDCPPIGIDKVDVICSDNETYQIPKQFLVWIADVMKFGAKKHGDDNWAKKDGTKSSHKEMHDSMFHHLADSFSNGAVDVAKDNETTLPSLAHLATRALMRLFIQVHNIRKD